ncbi:MAG: 2-hydroxyacid dehydrogenase [Ruminococcus sp.]|nr:2-hydroxyacid dehydrogenase [Ruminococcus sp.]
MKTAVFDTKPYDIPAFERFGNENGVTFIYYETKLNERTVSLANGCEAVCVFVNDTVNAAVIDELADLGVRTIALRCAGYNNVDIAHAKGKIKVVRVPAYSPYAVAEHAMAMLLTSVRRIHKAFIRTRDFNFSLNGLTGFDLHGRTVGIIGTGKIGRVFGDICRGFGMKVIAYDKYPDNSGKIEYVPLDVLFEQSDIISFHCPLTAETYHTLNAENIQKLRKGVVIINTSRGALIDAEALLEGIKSRRIGAACLDVYEEEADFFFKDLSGHIMGDDVLARLISMPNVIVTSHQAFLTEEALSNIAETTVDNIVKLHNGEKCKNELTTE